MKKFLIVNLSDKSIASNYDAEEATIYGGPWGDSSQFATMEVPVGIDYRTHNIVEVVLAEGALEETITFDIKHISTDMMMGAFTKYFKFVEDATKLADITASDEAAALKEAKDAMVVVGAAKKALADRILAIIAGHNETNGLDATQIASIETSHPEILALLQKGMPITAQPLIAVITPDGIVITQLELDHVALEYAEFLA